MNLSKKFEDLTKWLAANDHNSNIDIDNITDPQDPLTKQWVITTFYNDEISEKFRRLLDNVAEDSALEDVMYHLEKALHKVNLFTIELYQSIFLCTFFVAAVPQLLSYFKKIYTTLLESYRGTSLSSFCFAAEPQRKIRCFLCDKTACPKKLLKNTFAALSQN